MVEKKKPLQPDLLKVDSLRESPERGEVFLWKNTAVGQKLVSAGKHCKRLRRLGVKDKNINGGPKCYRQKPLSYSGRGRNNFM